MQNVHVGLEGREYDILIGPGLLAQAGDLIRKISDRKRMMIVTDENVAALHLATLQEGLAAAGIASEALVLPAGEATKSHSTVRSKCGQLLVASPAGKTNASDAIPAAARPS